MMFKCKPRQTYLEEEAIDDLGEVGISPPRPGVAALKKLVILAVLVAAFVQFMGVPHLRVSYTFQGTHQDPIILTARYWSVTGERHVGRYERDRQGLTLFALFPLDEPLWVHGGRAVQSAWAYTWGSDPTSTQNTPNTPDTP